MTKICYCEEKNQKNTVKNIDTLMANFDLIQDKIKDENIPLDFSYRDYILSILDSIGEYKSIFNDIIEKINNFEYEIASLESDMFKRLNSIEELYKEK